MSMAYMINKKEFGNVTSLWMIIAFVAGLVFAAVSWLTFSPVMVLGHQQITPMVPSLTPENLYPADLPDCRLVRACPQWEANILRPA